MLRQDAIDGRPEPHQPPAQRERIDAERLDQIVGSGFVFEWQTQTLRTYPSAALREREGPAPKACEGEGL